MGGGMVVAAVVVLFWTHCGAFLIGLARGWNDACRTYKCERKTDREDDNGRD